MMQRGFSVIEMIVSLLLLGLLGSTLGYALTNGVIAFSDNADTLQRLDKLRFANERMAREVREIRRNSVNPERLDITTMTTTTLMFTRADGTEVTIDVDPPRVTLAYAFPAGTWTLTDDVERMEFTYYQGDGSSLATDSTDVAFVEFELTLAGNVHSLPQRTRVALRNIGSGNRP